MVCGRSGSALDPDSIHFIDPDPDWAKTVNSDPDPDRNPDLPNPSFESRVKKELALVSLWIFLTEHYQIFFSPSYKCLIVCDILTI
jgi:hypothetical protein